MVWQIDERATTKRQFISNKFFKQFSWRKNNQSKFDCFTFSSAACSDSIMSVTNARVTRSKNLCDVTNRSLRSSRSPQKTYMIASTTTVMKRKKAPEIPEKRIKNGEINGTAIDSTEAHYESMSQKAEETTSAEKTPADIYESNLERVLAEGYSDISARLKLPTPPKCIFNLKYCYDNHFKKEVSIECHFLFR